MQCRYTYSKIVLMIKSLYSFCKLFNLNAMIAEFKRVFNSE